MEQREGNDEIDSSIKLQTIESRRGNTDNWDVLPFYANGLTDDGKLIAEEPSAQSIAEHDSRRFSTTFVTEESAGQWLGAKQFEIIGRHTLGQTVQGNPRSFNAKITNRVHRYFRQRTLLIAIRGVSVAIDVPGPVRLSVNSRDRDKPARIWSRYRPKHNRVR